MAASSPGKLSSISVVIEWENALLADLTRSKRMLQELARQVVELAGAQASALSSEREFLEQIQMPVELVVLYPEDEIDGVGLSDLLTSELAAARDYIDLSLIAAADVHYYEFKNLGFERASGDIAICLDSDVVPEPGWLSSLVSTFRDENVKVAGGTAYIEPTSLYARAFALFWFFPTRTEDGEHHLHHRFWANNVAFRREVFTKYRFSETEGLTRGACVDLARDLVQSGIQVYSNPSARVSHPPPDGFNHFIVRGLAEGRDYFFGDPRTMKRGALGRLATLIKRYGGNLWRSAQRVARDFGKVGLNPLYLPIAYGIAFCYYSLFMAGEAISWCAPDYARSRFRV